MFQQVSLYKKAHNEILIKSHFSVSCFCLCNCVDCVCAVCACITFLKQYFYVSIEIVHGLILSVVFFVCLFM